MGYCDFHTDGKSGDETDYNARIAAYIDYPKDLVRSLLVKGRRCDARSVEGRGNHPSIGV